MMTDKDKPKPKQKCALCGCKVDALCKNTFMCIFNPNSLHNHM